MFVFLFLFALLTWTNSHQESHFLKFKSNPLLKGTSHKCSKLYSNSMIQYIRKNNTSNKIFVKNAIKKLSNATGETVEFVSKCLGI